MNDLMSNTKSVATKKRFVFGLLLTACIALIIALASQTNRIHEAWLSKRSISELKTLAASKDADSLSHLLYGERLESTNNMKTALEEFQLAEQKLEMNQRDSIAERVYGGEGFTLAMLGEAEKAVPYLEQARRIDKNSWIALLGEATLLLNRRELAAAISQFRLESNRKPESWEACYLLGLAYNEDRNPKAAVESLKKAVMISPNFAPAQAELGHSFAYQGEYQAAIERFRLARKLEPASQDYLYAMGEAQGLSARSQEQYVEAAKTLEECLKATPENADLLFTLGQLHLRFMNLTDSYRFLKLAAERRPRLTKAWYNLGRVAQLLGKNNEADHANAIFSAKIAQHEDVIASIKTVIGNAQDPAARLDLAKKYLIEENISGAFSQLQTAISLRPDFTEAQNELRGLNRRYQESVKNGGMMLKPNDTDETGPPPPADLSLSANGKAR